MFKVHMVDGGHILGWERYPAGALTPKIGLAMQLVDGSLAVASGTTKPTYICMVEGDGPVEAGTILHTVRVTEDQIWETTLSADGSGVQPGDKVTLSADGLQVTGTTTSGVAEIVEMLGTAAGDTVRVRFV